MSLHAKPHTRVRVRLTVTWHLHCWQNDRHGGGTDTEIRVSTESWPWRRKFSRRSCRDSNLRPSDHGSGALTTEITPHSPPPPPPGGGGGGLKHKVAGRFPSGYSPAGVLHSWGHTSESVVTGLDWVSSPSGKGRRHDCWTRVLPAVHVTKTISRLSAGRDYVPHIGMSSLPIIPSRSWNQDLVG